MIKQALLALAVALSASPAAAHPHMFVDAQSTLILDQGGRLAGVRTALIIDPLTTQFVLEQYNLGVGVDLTDEDRRVIAEGMVEGLAVYGYFTEITRDGALVDVAAASVSQVQLHDDLLAAALELTLAEPFSLDGADVEIALFDPTYYAAVTTLGPPVLPEMSAACAVDFTRFEPHYLDAATLLELSRLARDETPSESRVGARFADRSRLTCAG